MKMRTPHRTIHVISLLVILSWAHGLEAKKSKKQICPIGFKLAYNRLKGDFICYKRKELESFAASLDDCDGNLYSSELYRSLNISKLEYSNTLWSEYKSFYPGGPFVSWSRNENDWVVVKDINNYLPDNLKDDTDQDLCLVVNRTGEYVAVQCDDKFYRYCLVKPYGDREDLSKRGCEGFKGSWRFDNSKDICLLGVTGVGGGTVRATWNQSQALCARHGGALLSRGWQYANMPLFHMSDVSPTPVYPLGMMWDPERKVLRYVSEDGVVEKPYEMSSSLNNTEETMYIAIKDESWMPVNSTYLFFDVICEHSVRARNLTLTLSINPENKIILDVNESVDKDDIHCTTDSESYRPSKVKIHHDDAANNYVLSPATDGYYWCEHIDKYNLQIVQSNKVLFVRERDSLINLYSVKINLLSGNYTFENAYEMKEEWIDKLDEYVFYRTRYVQMFDVDKILDPMVAEKILFNFKASRAELSWRDGEAIYNSVIKRLYMNKHTVLLHVELNPEMIPVTPGFWTNLEVVFMKPAYYCKGFDSVPRLSLGESTLTRGCRTYSCIGDFNEGVQWLESETNDCTPSSSVPISVSIRNEVTMRTPTLATVPFPVTTTDSSTTWDPPITVNHTTPLPETTRPPLPPEEQLVQVMQDLEQLLQNDTGPVTVDMVDGTFDQVNELFELDDDLPIPGSLLHMLDELGSRVYLNGSHTGKAIRGNIALLMADTAPDNPVRGVRIGVSDTSGDTFTNDTFEFIENEINSTQIESNNSEAVVYLPQSVTSTPRRISFVIFRNERAFQANQSVSVNSRVVSVNVENVTEFEAGECPCCDETKYENFKCECCHSRKPRSLDKQQLLSERKHFSIRRLIENLFGGRCSMNAFAAVNTAQLILFYNPDSLWTTHPLASEWQCKADVLDYKIKNYVKHANAQLQRGYYRNLTWPAFRTCRPEYPGHFVCFCCMVEMRENQVLNEYIEYWDEKFGIQPIMENIDMLDIWVNKHEKLGNYTYSEYHAGNNFDNFTDILSIEATTEYTTSVTEEYEEEYDEYEDSKQYKDVEEPKPASPFVFIKTEPPTTVWTETTSTEEDKTTQSLPNNEVTTPLEYFNTTMDASIMIDQEQVLEDLETLLQDESSIPITSVEGALDNVNLLFEDESLNLTGEILQKLDQLGPRVDLEGSHSAVMVRENLAVIVAETDPLHPVRGLRITTNRHDTFNEDCFDFISGEDYSQYLSSNESDAVVSLPSYITNSNKRMSFVVFRDDRAFQPRKGMNDSIVNSRILSVNVENVTRFEEGGIISLYLRPTKTNVGRHYRRTCAYWLFLDDGTGYWSQDGCTFAKSPTGQLDICQCNHLTHFAEVLIAVHRFSEQNEVILEILSIAGCCLSIVGILLVAVTAIVFRSWRNDFSNKIWLQLCSGIFILNVCFLLKAFIEFDKDIWCMIVGVVMHYSLLVSFFWMLIAAIISYGNLVLVFKRDITRKLLKSSLFAWGSPALIVGILLAINSQTYMHKFEDTSRNSSFCYPSGLSLWLSVYLPLSLIVIINWSLFIAILRSMFASKQIRRHGNSKDTLRSAVVSCLLVFLFGLPWIFGLIAYNIIAAYIFTISASLQGFVLFIFFIVANKRTRDLWVRKLRSEKGRSMPLSMSTESTSGSRAGPSVELQPFGAVKLRESDEIKSLLQRGISLPNSEFTRHAEKPDEYYE
ncbi:uncharacterized protein LOC106142285 isoform X2 [Amyelois transitella]|uniref:uncharacterized protein LOC106142285 isoform X2 n=1 Tax=Amyelois transitella TaxID=680683 RepID=UPI00298F817C|nr:uncharacterized protein LOC106142285 isoform X2 [Amyelois transitella]